MPTAHLQQIRWQKLGRIIQPNAQIGWMKTFSGAACAVQNGGKESPIFDIYLTGRDEKNRSQIGRFQIDIQNPTKVLNLENQAIISFGQLGAFDENGVSYPYIVPHNKQLYLYYIGWMPTVLTPFNLQMGLAIQPPNKHFKRHSYAPILARNHEDFLSVGSCCVLKEGDEWRMWYTAFLRWGDQPTDHKHYYVIKYARSDDGIHWERNNHICIDFANESEYAICRPTVWQAPDNQYFMWYAYRGHQYKIGFATSKDGINWERQDDLAGIDISENEKAWDGKSVCYPFVFEFKEKLYMLYNGNEYGRTGLGIAMASFA